MYKGKDYFSKHLPITHKESSPIDSLNELIDDTFESLDENLYAIFVMIVGSWLDLPDLKKAWWDRFIPYFVKGRIRINPSTGKPLTYADVKKIDDALDKMLEYGTKIAKDNMSRKSVLLGELLSDMPTRKQYKIKLNELNLMGQSKKALDYVVQFAEQNAANHIQGINDQLKKDIKASIIYATQNKMSARQLEKLLFDRFVNTNKNFRMIAETESTINVQAGYLQNLLDISGGKPVFVKGISAPDACDICLEEINQKVFLVTDGPVSGNIEVNGVKYVPVWPGKLNAGIKKANQKPAIPRHPHCRCQYIKFNINE